MSTPLTLAPASRWLRTDPALAGQPMLIAGPCSAESEAQVLATALALSQLGIGILRIGIWKPRTRPNTFEGAGSEGLHWSRRVQQLTGMAIATEVATPQHVEDALAAGIDYLWLGARTTVNPFAVQAIADALRGVQVPVLVKNPINPELGLWVGALERLNQAGITELAACHRGFSYYGRARYRNVPQWDIPLELRRLHPTLPLFCDPSHIAGHSALVAEVAQTAMDLGFDGLMIESHLDPAHALSDAAQQITPAELKQLLAGLRVRQTQSTDSSYQHELAQLRTLVDEADRGLLETIARRIALVQRIAQLKEENGVRFFEHERMREVLASRLQAGRGVGLSDSFTNALLRLLHRESFGQIEE